MSEAQEYLTLEEMREREQKANETLIALGENAKELMAAGMLQATGYRVLVKPIQIKRTLEAGAAEVAPTLAKKGFIEKSEQEAKRQERGENHGIVLHLGPIAFKRLGEAWCKEGDLVLYTRYAGTRVEHPPGSGNHFQIINDDDIFGKIV